MSIYALDRIETGDIGSRRFRILILCANLSKHLPWLLFVYLSFCYPLISLVRHLPVLHFLYIAWQTVPITNILPFVLSCLSLFMWSVAPLCREKSPTSQSQSQYISFSVTPCSIYIYIVSMLYWCPRPDKHPSIVSSNISFKSLHLQHSHYSRRVCRLPRSCQTFQLSHN